MNNITDCASQQVDNDSTDEETKFNQNGKDIKEQNEIKKQKKKQNIHADKLKKIINQLKDYENNHKTFILGQLKKFDNVYVQDPSCHILLLQYFELCVDKLLNMKDTNLFATEKQKQDIIKHIEQISIIIEKIEQIYPIQNHLFNLRIIGLIFEKSQAIQTISEQISFFSISLYQLYAVSTKFDKEALKSLLEKFREICQIHKSFVKIGGILEYNQKVLTKLNEQSYISCNSISRKSTFDFSMINSQLSQSIIDTLDLLNEKKKPISFDQDYDCELYVRHDCIDPESHFRVQYYALMQIDKLIQKMIDDEHYKINDDNQMIFQEFIIDNKEKGMINYSGRQYWFKSLEHLKCKRHLLLRYISLSILIRCYELFTSKSPQNQLIEHIYKAIHLRSRIEIQQSVKILILNNKVLCERLGDPNEQNNIGEQIQQQYKEQQIENIKDEEDIVFDDEKQKKDQQLDTKLFANNIFFIVDEIQKGKFIQSEVFQKDYIIQQYNKINQNQNEFYTNQNAKSKQTEKQFDLLESLELKFKKVQQIQNIKAIIIQGNSGIGKTTLVNNLFKRLITTLYEEQNRKQDVSQTCIQIQSNSITYLPVLIKLQNINTKTEKDFIDSLISEFKPIMKAQVNKLLIIDGINEENKDMLYNALNSLKNEWRNYILLITCQSQANQSQKELQNNQNNIQFLKDLGIEENSIEEYDLQQFNSPQIIDYINKSFKKINFLQYQMILTQFLTIAQKIGKNPLNLQMLYKICSKFYQINLYINNIPDLENHFFQAQFCSTFSHWRQKNIDPILLQIFNSSYLQFFKQIAKYMQKNNQKYISKDEIQNQIKEEVVQYIENKCTQPNISLSIENINEGDISFDSLQNQFLSILTQYFNLEVFQQMQSNDYKNPQMNLVFKHDRYYHYFLNLQ